MIKTTSIILLSLFSILNVSVAQNKTEKATFGMGCFWCTEAIFQKLKGVITVKSGYEGGKIEKPTYEEVCSGLTGHAEVIEITFDPTKIKYDELLEVFWKSHDATTLNRQGADVGTQYRSVIFYHNNNQKELATQYKSKLNKDKVFGKNVVTAIEAAKPFYVAENYHQNYYKNNSNAPYCRAVIQPKIEKLEKIFKSKLKD
jgi:peptide-methionine (S)-S-oxide reductase